MAKRNKAVGKPTYQQADLPTGRQACLPAGRKEKKSYSIFLFIIRFSLVLALLGTIWERTWIALFVSLLTLVLTFLPSFIQQTYRIKLPAEIQIIIILFIYGSLFLGLAREWYHRIWWWDSLMHAFSGLALGFSGFLILYVLYKSGKMQTSSFLIVLFSFCFAVTMGTLWEIFEFSVDIIFSQADMQRTKTMEEVIAYGHPRLAIYDTMRDLILNTIGALIASFSGYVFLKKGKIFIFDKLMKKFDQANPNLS